MGDKLDERTEKYVYCSAQAWADGNSSIDEVVLLASKMNATPLGVSVVRAGGATFQRIVSPFNMSADRAELTRSFAALGIEAARSGSLDVAE